MVRLTVVAGGLAGIALSLPLWLTRTDYPRVSAFEFIPALPRPFDMLLLITFGAGLAFLVARPELKGVAGIVFSVGALLMLQDQSRLQPWFIEYLLLFAAVTFSVKEKAALNTCCLILVSVYFWSGVHKMNTSFITNLFPWTDSKAGPIRLDIEKSRNDAIGLVASGHSSYDSAVDWDTLHVVT